MLILNSWAIDSDAKIMAEFAKLLDTAKLRIEYQVQGSILVLRPRGALDEDVNFSMVLDLIAGLGPSVRVVRFDLGEVKSLNSCGIREWLLFMERVPKALGLTFVNVNELFVEQANLISNLLGKKASQVLSFQAPYHCDSCGTDVNLVLEPGSIRFEGEQPQAPAAQCPKCGNALAFDSLEEEYFSFIRRAA